MINMSKNRDMFHKKHFTCNVLHKRAKGNIGEGVATRFLESKGFLVLDRNYLRKWGELDIVAQKDGMIHFFEVKSASLQSSSYEHKPEDNVHELKAKHLRRIIETYLEEKCGGLEAKFQFHVLCVFLDMSTRKGRVQWLQNIIL